MSPAKENAPISLATGLTTAETSDIDMKLGKVATLVMCTVHSCDSIEVQAALDQLSRMCKAADPDAVENKRNFVMAGGYGTLIHLVEKWPGSIPTHVKTLRVLCNATCDNPLIPTEMGMVEMVVVAIARYPYNVTLLETALIALNNLTNANQVNMERIVDGNGLRVVVKGMIRFPEHAPILIWGTKLFLKASVSERFAMSLVQGGGLKALSNVIRSSPIQENRREARTAAMALLTHLQKCDIGDAAGNITAKEEGAATAVAVAPAMEKS